MTATARTPVFGPDGALDASLPWHYGDPHAEQRALLAGGAAVDLSNRGVLTVSGRDRLSWLNDLLTQEVRGLTPGDSALALVLDPHGHVEYELHLTAGDDRVWITTEGPHAEGLAKYLDSMRFMLDVAVTDVSDGFATLWISGVGATDNRAVAVWSPPNEFTGLANAGRGTDAGGGADKYVPVRPGALHGNELIVPRSEISAVLADQADLAGTWALEALRIAAGVPRVGQETDHRTLPHEVGWIGPAVHLSKGCYRGQETIARVHNLGRPPRRMVLLHLDGSAEAFPTHGDPVTVEGRTIGFVGSAARHFELGPIATAIIKRSIPSDSQVVVLLDGETEVAASIEDIVVSG